MLYKCTQKSRRLKKESRMIKTTRMVLALENVHCFREKYSSFFLQREALTQWFSISMMACRVSPYGTLPYSWRTLVRTLLYRRWVHKATEYDHSRLATRRVSGMGFLGHDKQFAVSLSPLQRTYVHSLHGRCVMLSTEKAKVRVIEKVDFGWVIFFSILFFTIQCYNDQDWIFGQKL